MSPLLYALIAVVLTANGERQYMEVDQFPSLEKCQAAENVALIRGALDPTLLEVPELQGKVIALGCKPIGWKS